MGRFSQENIIFFFETSWPRLRAPKRNTLSRTCMVLSPTLTPVQAFAEYFDMSQMEKRFGGSSDFEYRHSEFWPALIEDYWSECTSPSPNTQLTPSFDSQIPLPVP